MRSSINYNCCHSAQFFFGGGHVLPIPPGYVAGWEWAVAGATSSTKVTLIVGLMQQDMRVRIAHSRDSIRAKYYYDVHGICRQCLHFNSLNFISLQIFFQGDRHNSLRFLEPVM